MGRGSLMALLVGAAGCGLGGISDDPEPTNEVSFTLDGQTIDILQELSMAVFSESKNIAGPNSGIFVIGGSPPTSVDRVWGTKLALNLPHPVTVGTHPVFFTTFAGRENVHLTLTSDTGHQWWAYDGEIEVLEVGDIGSRLRFTFGEIPLVDDCGSERTLQGGSFDVLIGAETVYPEVEIEELGITAEVEASNEGSGEFRVEGLQKLCSADNLLITADDGTGTMRDELRFGVYCGCGWDISTGWRESGLLSVDIPLDTVGGAAVDGFVTWSPGYPADPNGFVELALGTVTVHERPTAAGERVHLEFERIEPMWAGDFSDVNLIDPSRRVQIESLTIRGIIHEDCRPGQC